MPTSFDPLEASRQASQASPQLDGRDLPLTRYGERIYSPRWSSPIITCSTAEIAEEVERRLTRDISSIDR